MALCNGWTTGVEKAENLFISMEGAAAETVRGLTADKDEYYDLIWENLSHRFGHIDEPEHAKRRFDVKKQLESETIEVFEQGFRTIFREAWSTGDRKCKKMTPCSSAASLMVSLTRLSNSFSAYTLEQMTLRSR